MHTDKLRIAHPVEPAGYADWYVVSEAQHIVEMESLAIDALSNLTTDQLRSLVWVGLLDEGWFRMFAELKSRGAEL